MTLWQVLAFCAAGAFIGGGLVPANSTGGVRRLFFVTILVVIGSANYLIITLFRSIFVRHFIEEVRDGRVSAKRILLAYSGLILWVIASGFIGFLLMHLMKGA